MDIRKMKISSRAKSCLLRAGYKKSDEIEELSDEELLSIKNFNRSCLEEIRKAFSGLDINSDDDLMDIEDAVDYIGNTQNAKSDDYVENPAIKIPISKLNLSVRSNNCLRRAGMDIVRDICVKSVDDMIKVRNLGRKSLEEVLGKLDELGCSLRSDDEDSFLYGYPDYVKDIARNKPELWEYRLYVELIIFNYEWLSEFRKEEAVFWNNEKNMQYIGNSDELIGLIKEKLDIISKFTNDMMEAINTKAIEAFGAPGEPGDAYKITAAVEAFMLSYRKWIRWRLSFSEIDADRKYRKAIEKLYVATDSVLDGVDELYEKALTARKIFNDYAAGKIEKVNIDLQVNITANNNAFEELLNEVKESVFSENISENDEFEDIVIYEGDENNKLRVEFCGLEFHEDTETIEINIWVKNNSDTKYKIWARDVIVNEDMHESFDLLGTIDENEGHFLNEYINDVFGLDYSDIETISFLVEIDDEDNNILAYSKAIYLECNTSNESFSVEKLEEHLDEKVESDDDFQTDDRDHNSDLEILEKLRGLRSSLKELNDMIDKDWPC